MALPFIILGVAAGAAAFGGKKAYDGYQKKSEAEDILEKAKERYEEHKEKFEQAEAQTSSKLTTLGNKELEIGKDFSEFDRIAAELLARLEKEGNKDLKLSVPQHNINKIQKPGHFSDRISQYGRCCRSFRGCCGFCCV